MAAPSPEVRPFGSWSTPITSELIVKGAASLAGAAVVGDEVWWAEGRPEEGGRIQIVRRRADGSVVDVLPDGFAARTSVHEYGGGAWWADGSTLWFANWADQLLYRLDTSSAGARPVAVSPEPEVPRGDRWADGVVSPDGKWLLCVREHHPEGGGPADVLNQLVRFELDLAEGGVMPEVLVHGPDFVSDPGFRPDGGALCWLEWDHPNMPWDGTRLMVLDGDRAPVLVAGGADESVAQPRWHPDGSLWFVSDRSGWWNLYRRSPSGHVEPMVTMEAELAGPQWVFGLSSYAFLDDGRTVFAYSRDGFDHLAVRAHDGSVAELDLPFTSIDSVQAAGSSVVFIGATPTTEAAVVRVPIDGSTAGSVEVLAPPRDLGLDPALLSAPEAISFPTGDGQQAYGLFYPPTNPAFVGPPGERPPLLVMIHGGPTSAAIPALRLGVQYWTSRGFAVVDVNYRGSTGYGRPFRNLLRRSWGVADVEDCQAAAAWLASEGRVNGQALCIRGGSAGGFTTLAALAFGDTFAAGASHYGVADLEALALDTHKFESRYLDTLVGPYPEEQAVYRDRSPIHHVDGFDRPLIVLQGLDDPVVPPNQAEMIVDALRAKHVPVAYVPFEGEQHGFRQAANIRRALDAELSFYAQVLGFELASEEGIEPVEVER